MNKSLALKNKFYLFFSLIFLFLLFLYLLNVLINAPRGIISYQKINVQKNDYNFQLSELKNKNEFFLDRISRLQPNTLDVDFLDEQLRQKTGLIYNDEILVILEE